MAKRCFTLVKNNNDQSLKKHQIHSTFQVETKQTISNYLFSETLLCYCVFFPFIHAAPSPPPSSALALWEPLSSADVLTDLHPDFIYGLWVKSLPGSCRSGRKSAPERTLLKTPRWRPHQEQTSHSSLRRPLVPPTHPVSHQDWADRGGPAWLGPGVAADTKLVLVCVFTGGAAEPCWYCLRSLHAEYRPEAPRQVATTLPKPIRGGQ